MGTLIAYRTACHGVKEKRKKMFHMIYKKVNERMKPIH